MSALISCFWIAIELGSMYIFQASFLKRRQSILSTALIMLALYAVCAILDITTEDLIPPLVQKTANVILGAAAALLIFSGPWYARIAVAVSSYFFLASLDMAFVYGAAALTGVSLSELMSKQGAWFLFVTADKLLCFAIYFALYRVISGRRTRTLSLRRTLLAVLLPFVSFAVLFELYQNAQQQDELTVSMVAISIVVMAANAAFLYLLGSLERASASEKELALLSQSMALQTESYESLERSYREQRTASHEYGHRLQVLSELLESGRTDEAREYVSELRQKHTSRILAANSGHPIVDAVLNDKYRRAKERDIDISYRLSDLSALKMSADSIVVLLSNLLDNAIEACIKLPEGRVIECSLLLEEDLLLSVRNTSPPVNTDGGAMETTKLPRHEHGFGLSGIERLVGELGGEWAVDYSEPWFQFTAVIPNREAAK